VIQLNKHSAFDVKITAEKTNIAQQTKDTTKNQYNTGYQLSDKERNKLSGKEAEQNAEKTANSEMPEYIAKMIEQLKELKQQLEEQKEQLTQLQAQFDPEDEVIQAQIEAQANIVSSTQSQVVALVQMISQAMKDAGITDAGALVSAIV
jgi:seryl-tRNA synthetase|tara:strand:- start:687 stop:1133 length:447 start_codon:yes stop_codon:yes gene_type:complete